MTIALPTSPLPQQATPSPVLFGGPVLAGLGGEDQFLNRLGARFQLDVTTPRLKPEPDGRLWIAALLKAWMTGERVSFPFPQPGLAIGTPGSALVDGAAQTGSTLNLKAMTPGYVVRKGQFFNVVDGGRRYVYESDIDQAVDGAGKLAAAINPMIRVSPADGATAEFLNPLIEGLLIGEQRSWTHVIARTQGLKFTIRETR